MEEKIESRLKELRNELELGQKAMEELETNRTNIVYSILRISGAIQALEEVEKNEEKQTF